MKIKKIMLMAEMDGSTHWVAFPSNGSSPNEYEQDLDNLKGSDFEAAKRVLKLEINRHFNER